jgi:hypothetical protein
MEGAVNLRLHVTVAEGDRPGTKHDVIDIGRIQSYWMPHPDPNIDLAVIPAGPFLVAGRDDTNKAIATTLRKSDVATEPELAQFSPGDEVLMIGYPTGIWDHVHNRPVFRRGIAATHPGLAYQGRPEFLIDVATFPGSSGSPVFLHNLIWYDRDRQTIAWAKTGPRNRLLGILWGGSRTPPKARS